MSFYEKVNNLCKEKGISISTLLGELGMSMGTATGWKNGAVPRSSVVKKIADYFQIEIGYFYDETSAPTPARTQGPQIAFNGGMEDLTPEEFDKVYVYIQFLKSQRK